MLLLQSLTVAFQINDYLWSKSIEIEPRSSDTIKRRNCDRRWSGLPLKSPGIRPKGLPGNKNPPNPLPKIGSRHRDNGSRDNDVSPLASPSFGSPVPVFRQSPVSTPVTPSYQSSPRETGDSLREEPVKTMVIIPTSIPAGKPPPLPPKPRNTPPLPPRDTSPPPPIPPRMVPSRPAVHTLSHRSPLESRPPLMDPVFPQASLPPTILPRQRNGCSLDPPISPAPMSRPPTSLPHSATWLPEHGQCHNGLGPMSAGPELGSHFTFGPHTPGGATVSPQLPPRPSRTTSTPR